MKGVRHRAAIEWDLKRRHHQAIFVFLGCSAGASAELAAIWRHGTVDHEGICLLGSGSGCGSRGGRRHANLLVMLLHLLQILEAFSFHCNPFADVAHAGVLEQRGEHHHETGAQKDIDRFDVGYFGQGSVGARHERGHG